MKQRLLVVALGLPLLLAVLLAWAVFADGDSPVVRLDECPKCDRRIRISEDGKSATVNLSRLKDDAPDEATLNANPLWDPLPPESALGPRRPVVGR